MDVKLQNAYVEVLLDNFIAVIKQNIMFQAQLEVLNKTVQEAEDIKRKVKELSDRNVELQSQLSECETNNQNLSGEVGNLKSTVTQKDVQVSSNNSLRQEKDRLQSAVNDYMRQIKKLNEDLLKAKSESSDALVKNATQVEELNKYIQKLEMVVPANKLKKVKTGDISDFVKIEEPIVDDETVKNGGTF